MSTRVGTRVSDYLAMFIRYKYITGSVFLVFLSFSYRPVISFGQLSGMNLELSVAQIAGVVFIIGCLPVLWTERVRVSQSVGTRLLAIYAFICSASILWAENQARAIVIALYVWFLFFLFVSVIAFISQHKSLHRYQPALWWSTIAISLFGWLQIMGDALGVSSALTLLRPEYQYHVFGFARASGFALEPLFFASLLLAPTLFGLWLFVKNRHSIIAASAFILGTSALVATLSRGALIGFAVASLMVIVLCGKDIKQRFVTFFIMILIVVTSVGLLTLAAGVNQRDAIGADDALIRATNHVSLGVLNISKPEGLAAEKQENSTIPKSNAASTPSEPEVAEGYVIESTDSRLLMSQEAIAIWSSRPSFMLFGVGVSNFSTQLQMKGEHYLPSSIVNNQYLEVLVETGLVGFLAFVALFIYPVLISIRRRWWLPAAVLVAFLIQWNFFSGNANIVHVWVMIAIVYALFESHIFPSVHYKNRKVRV